MNRVNSQIGQSWTLGRRTEEDSLGRFLLGPGSLAAMIKEEG